MCRIGDYRGVAANDAWLYKVNHKRPPVGGDRYRVRRGDEVLWSFANFGTGRNTGDELKLHTPARVRPNQPFQVSAVGYTRDGQVAPAAGVQVSGDATTVTGDDAGSP